MICEQCKMDTITDEDYVKNDTIICENCKNNKIKLKGIEEFLREFTK